MPNPDYFFAPSPLKIQADRQRLIECAIKTLSGFEEDITMSDDQIIQVPMTVKDYRKLKEVVCWATMGWAV
jgi:hypothetical protein